MDELVCRKCGKKLGDSFMQSPEVKFNGKSYCNRCANELAKEVAREAEEREKQEYQAALNDVLLSTTDTLQGYEIEKYIDILFELVYVSEGKYADGLRDKPSKISVYEYADMLLKQKIKQAGYKRGGNAVVGVRFSSYWTNEKEVSLMLPSLVVNAHGTIVKIVRAETE